MKAGGGLAASAMRTDTRYWQQCRAARRVVSTVTDPGCVKTRRRIVLVEYYCFRSIAATHLCSIFDEAAREARMPFYAVASPSRFHTTKTH